MLIRVQSRKVATLRSHRKLLQDGLRPDCHCRLEPPSNNVLQARVEATRFDVRLGRWKGEPLEIAFAGIAELVICESERSGAVHC